VHLGSRCDRRRRAPVCRDDLPVARGTHLPEIPACGTKNRGTPSSASSISARQLQGEAVHAARPLRAQGSTQLGWERMDTRSSRGTGRWSRRRRSPITMRSPGAARDDRADMEKVVADFQKVDKIREWKRGSTCSSSTWRTAISSPASSHPSPTGAVTNMVVDRKPHALPARGVARLPKNLA